MVNGCPVVVPAPGWHAGRLAIIRRPAVTHPPGAQPDYRRTPLSAEEKVRGEANFGPFVAEMLVARGRFRGRDDTAPQPARLSSYRATALPGIVSLACAGSPGAARTAANATSTRLGLPRSAGRP